MTARILIIDDEIRLTRSLAFALRQTGYECLESHGGSAGHKLALKEQPDLVLLDVRMPGVSGIEVLRALKAEMPALPVIIMSALDATQDAVKAVKLGAVDYLSKPFDMDDLIALIETTLSESATLSDQQFFNERRVEDASLLGHSAPMRQLREQVGRAAETGVPCILLRGEIGVGKAVVARDFHLQARGVDAPFVEINCATQSGEQIEAALFGEGGDLPRRGLIEAADGGTLFLHEVEALGPTAQARIMGFLDTGTIRLGSGQMLSPSLSLVVASNSDLETFVETGSFRRDLYLRLAMFPLDMAPLRDRLEDIDLLCQSFARDLALATGQKPVWFSKTALKRLAAYDWPGNVRELKNMVERLTILHPGALIEDSALPAEIRRQQLRSPETIEEKVSSVERDLVLEALQKARGRKGVAADHLGISRHALKRKMQRLGLS